MGERPVHLRDHLDAGSFDERFAYGPAALLSRSAARSRR